MNGVECTALLTYANQIDARIQLNEATFDVWWMALSRHDFEQAKYCVKLYYATTNTNSDRGLAALSPAMLRHRVSAERDRAESKRRALSAAPVVREVSDFKSSDPERWAALVAGAGDALKMPE